MTRHNQRPREQDRIQEYDVVICGAGLAGLTLARHLQQHYPERTLLLLERMRRPLPQTTLKVGESTTEAGAYYLSHILNLPNYFEQNHISKAGFRFFFGHAHGSFADRPEFGITQLPTIPSFNIERGRLENDLRQINADCGIPMIEGCIVKKIVPADHTDYHTVIYHNGEHTQKVRARWVIDAMGRRRYLQKQLNLTKPQLRRGSAAWFRLPAQVDVSDLVPQNVREWHDRVPGRIRYASTNHLMGAGYWIWLIPLTSGATSVGIVALEEIHPFDEFNTFNKARSWLQKYEPHLAAYLKDLQALDFKCMRRYSYSSQQMFSQARWACIGDAGIFSDPLYAPGVDFIALGNLITTELIKLDFAGMLDEQVVTKYNRFILALNETMTQTIQLSYPLFEHAVVMSAKVLWDTAAGWSLFAPQIFNPTFFTNDEVNAHLRKIKGAYYILSKRMQQFFIEWAANSPGRFTFKFIDFLSLPFMQDIRNRNLRPGKSIDELVEDQRKNMHIFEELAQALFLLAIKDVMPNQLERVFSAGWLNAWRISLKPERWTSDGLFRPHTEPRDLDNMVTQIRTLYQTKEMILT